jgi:hypothetical protein
MDNRTSDPDRGSVRWRRLQVVAATAEPRTGIRRASRHADHLLEGRVPEVTGEIRDAPGVFGAGRGVLPDALASPGSGPTRWRALNRVLDKAQEDQKAQLCRRFALCCDRAVGT